LRQILKLDLSWNGRIVQSFLCVNTVCHQVEIRLVHIHESELDQLQQLAD